MLSRTRPELNSTRLRAQRSYGELTGADLRFSTGEVEELYGSVFGMHLTGQTAALVNRSAEGWPAGLVLMHEYLASADPGSWNAMLSHRHPNRMQDHIFEYLAQEVLRHLPGELQEFLVRTCLSDAVPFALAGQLTSLPEDRVAACVEELLRRNLFVSPIDERHPVIRYHGLFREFLLKKLVASGSAARTAKLAATASRYFLRTHEPVSAVDVLLTCGQDRQSRRCD